MCDRMSDHSVTNQKLCRNRDGRETVLCMYSCTAVPTNPTYLPAQDNVNPIERAELSSLAMASCIHGVAPLEMAAPAHYDAVRLMMGPSLPDPS